ncbi:MAG: superoxide dismutase family protein [Burkholderiales bacterium]
MKTKLTMIAASVLVLGACETAEKYNPFKPSAKAQANLASTKGNTATGTVQFAQSGETVKVSGKIINLTPGKHGFHVHEKGDCGSGDGMSAGGHFNPDNAPHGGPDSAQRHGGDLGNITADENGVASFSIETSGITVEPGPNSIIGKGVIVHKDPDDLKSQPAGNAGPRVACGVIAAS